MKRHWEVGQRALWAAAMGIAVAARAQAEPAMSPSASGSLPVAAASGSDEIIVTAQKRRENVQNVPIAITALSGSQLAASGIVATRDLNLIVPGLNYTQSTVGALVVLRGVGSLNATPGQEALTPVYVDGVYQASQSALSFDLPNIDRIEVLKGPQGTLFGRNAVAGAISIVTKDPSPTPEGRVMIGYGRYATRTFEGYLSAPITPTLAANVSARFQEDDGYIHDIGTNTATGTARDPRRGGTRTSSVRAKLLWTPTERVRARLIGYITDIYTTQTTAFRPLTPISNALLTDPAVVFAPPYSYNGNIDGFSRAHAAGASADATISFPGFDVTGITSYARVQSDTLTDSDAGPDNLAWTRLRFLEKTYTEELRAASSGHGPLSWLVGANYFDNTSSYNPLTLALGTSIRTPTVTARAISVFGEAGLKLTSSLKIIGGLRFSSERRTLHAVANAVVIGDARVHFSNVTPRVTLQYALTPTVQAYATYSQGFKSGVFNASQATLPLTAVKPSQLYAYEVGLKTAPLPGLHVNLSAFHYDLKNLQETVRLPNTTTALINAGRARDYGGELEVNWRAGSRFALIGGVAYAHARYTDYPGAIYYVPRADGRGVQLVSDNAAGRPLLRAPDWTVNASATYTLPTGFGSVKFNTTYEFQSNFFWDAGSQVAEGPTHTVDGRITVANRDERLQLSLVGKNLLNSHYYDYKFNTNLVNYGVQTRPIWYGVEASYQF